MINKSMCGLVKQRENMCQVKRYLSQLRMSWPIYWAQCNTKQIWLHLETCTVLSEQCSAPEKEADLSTSLMSLSRMPRWYGTRSAQHSTHHHWYLTGTQPKRLRLWEECSLLFWKALPKTLPKASSWCLKHFATSFAQQHFSSGQVWVLDTHSRHTSSWKTSSGDWNMHVRLAQGWKKSR